MSPATKRAVERRTQVLRRDWNDVVRDADGRVSPHKIGMIVGQMVSVHLLLWHTDVVIKMWDVLAVLFTVLIAPEMWKKLMSWRFSGGQVK